MLRFSVRRVFRFCALIPWIIALAYPVSAEEVTKSDHPDVEVTEVVVSATKTPTPPKQVTSAVEVITGEEMQQRNIRTVVEALRWAQGLSINQNGGPGTLATVRMRGGTSEQTLVLIDGAIVNSATAGAYDFSGTISRWDMAGFSAINYRRGATERDGYYNWQGSARLGMDLPKHGRLDFSFRWLEGMINFDGFAFNPVTFASDPADVLGARSKDTEYIFGGHYAQPITDWWSQRLTLLRATDSLLNDGGTFERDLVTGATGPVGFPFRSQIETTSNRIEWQHNVQVGKPLLLTAGYQYLEQKGSNTDLLTQTATFSDKILSSHAGFGEAQLNLWDRVFGTAGIRQDEYNAFGSATTYRVTGGVPPQGNRHEATRQLLDWISSSHNQSIIFPRIRDSDSAAGEEPIARRRHRTNISR